MAVTRKTLRTNARVRADMVSSTFRTDTQYNTFINSAVKGLYNLLVKADPGYFEATHTFDSAVDQTDYELPPDFFKLLGVERQTISNSQWETILPYPHLERNRYSSTFEIYTQPIEKYRLMGSKIRISPEPSEVRSWRLRYVPLPTLLQGDSDELTGMMEYFSEYIEIFAAIKALHDEESAAAGLKEELAGLVQQIDQLAQDRDVWGPEVIGSSSRMGYYDEWEW